MLTRRQHVLPTHAQSTNESTMGMPQDMPKEPRRGQPGAKENRGHPKRPPRARTGPGPAAGWPPPPKKTKTPDYVLTCYEGLALIRNHPMRLEIQHRYPV